MLTLIPPSSGSVQGLTYSHNRGGAYTRKRATPVVGTRTPRQGVVKANMTVASQAWQLLTPTEQGAWISYANGHPITNRLGSSIKLTGAQYFIKCAAALLNAGQPLPTAPPVSTTIQPVVVVGFAMTDTPAMTLLLTPGTAGDFINVGIAKWTSAGVNFNKTFSQVFTAASDAEAIDVTAAWVAFAGGPAVNQKAWLRLTPVNAGGLTGSPTYLQTPVLAAGGVATPVATSPSSGTLTLTWAGAPTTAYAVTEYGPTITGPFTVSSTFPGATSPQNDNAAPSGQYGRGYLIDPLTFKPGPESNAVLIT